MTKKRNFDQKLKFYSNIEIVTNYRNFGQKSKFWRKIDTLVKNWNFSKISKFCQKSKKRNFTKVNFWLHIPNNCFVTTNKKECNIKNYFWNFLYSGFFPEFKKNQFLSDRRFFAVSIFFLENFRKIWNFWRGKKRAGRRIETGAYKYYR